MRSRLTVEALLPFAALLALVVAALAEPAYGSHTFGAFDIYNALQGIAGPALLALGIGLTMVAGEFDLSTLGAYAFGGMIAVKTGGGSPVLGIIAACAACAAFGALQGAAVARLRVNSMALTLGGYIVLIGLTGVIGDNNSVIYSRPGVSTWLDQVVGSFISPRALISIAVFVVVGVLLASTNIGRNLRAIGGDAHASRAAGVPVSAYLAGVFSASGLLAGLGGALVAFSSASASSTITLRPLIFGVTAVLIGGVSLSGGRGNPLGIAAGAVTLALLAQILVSQAAPAYWSDIATGGLLFVSAAFDARGLRLELLRLRTRLGRGAAALTPLDTPRRDDA